MRCVCVPYSECAACAGVGIEERVRGQALTLADIATVENSLLVPRTYLHGTPEQQQNQFETLREHEYMCRKEDEFDLVAAELLTECRDRAEDA